MTATTTTFTRPSTAGIRLATALSALAVLATTTTARANPIGPGFSLSASEAARPILLDANGTQIRVLKGAKGGSVTRPAGASPAYVAFRLDKQSELPAGYPTVNVGGTTPHSGPARGPLRLDTLAKTALDAELAKSGGAAVHLPRQTYVVESLSSLLGSSDPSTQIWLAATAAGGGQARPATSGGSSLGDTLKGWFNTSTDAVENLNKSISDAIKKQLQLDPPKPVIYPPLNKPQAATTTAAQLLAPPSAADGSIIQPAPVPEPASLLIFAAAAGAVALRMRKRAA